MLTRGLDGYEYRFKPKDAARANASNLHTRALNVVRTMWSTLPVFQEVRTRISYQKYVYYDIYIPSFDMFIEVHGQQHYAYSRLFHKSRMDFLKQKRQDRDKKEWCEINCFNYIELPYSENDKEWGKRINQSLNE